MGPVAAVDNGYIKLEKLGDLVKSTAMYKMLKLDAYQHHSIRGEWHWGPAGAGKSYGVRQKYPGAFNKPSSKWWDGYQGEKHVIIDDLDSDCLSHYLKIWADSYACSGEAKGYTIPLQHEKLIVTSNYSIERLFANKGPELIDALTRRFEIIEYPIKDDI